MSSPTTTKTLRVCILDNDNLDPAVVDTYVSYGAMTEKMFAAAGVPWQFERFNTTRGEYPASFDAYDAVLLTGSKADSFSDEPWVRTLRERTTELLEQRKKLLGICFGHQLIAYCLGAEVGRAPQGWGMGRMGYDWVGADAAEAAAPTHAEPAGVAPGPGAARCPPARRCWPAASSARSRPTASTTTCSASSRTRSSSRTTARGSCRSGPSR